jgi:hypothetical protein
MTDPALHVQIGAATVYQDQLVPALMEQWAPRAAPLATAVKPATGRPARPSSGD